MLELTPERLIEVVMQRCAESIEPLIVLWYQVAAEREDLYRHLKRLRGELRLVPLVLRRAGFDDPNAVMSDLRELIEENRREFEPPEFRTAGEGQIVIVLLSRREFSLPQGSSPTVLPDWFPQLGGRNVHVLIENLTYTSTASLRIPEARIEDLCTKLFELEGALLERLGYVSGRDHNLGNSFFAAVSEVKAQGKAGQEKYADFLAGAISCRAGVLHPRDFRPGTKDNRSLIGRLLLLMQSKNPDQLGRPAQSFSTALGITDETVLPPFESLPAVLFRPTKPDEEVTKRFGRNLLLTIYAASQFVTAYAHADYYPAYPILLIRAVSHNLRMTLDRLRRTVAQLPDLKG